ncbi:MAG: hypothetical protein WCW16_02270 [Candidatus Magasanikbacteria bacterium]
MKTLPLKYRIISVTGIIFLGVLAIGLGIIYPTTRHIVVTRKSIEKTESQLEEQYQKAKLLRRSIVELDTIKQKMSQLNKITLNKGDELVTIREFEQLAARHSLKQKLDVVYNDGKNIDSKPKKEKVIKRPHYIFSFSLEGSYKNLMSYIQDLERTPYYIIIEQLSWTRPSKSEQQTVILEFDGRVYSKE